MFVALLAVGLIWETGGRGQRVSGPSITEPYFTFGKRYGVELVYDELDRRTERIRFPERLGPARVTVCEPASPC